jgi:hypothetical protein
LVLAWMKGLNDNVSLKLQSTRLSLIVVFQLLHNNAQLLICLVEVELVT